MLPLAAWVLVLMILENSSIDLWLADHWYALEGQRWAWRNHWLSYELIHHRGKQLLIGFGLVMLTLIALGLHFARFGKWRLPLIYCLTSMMVIPVAIARFKSISPVPCPWDLSRYGGDIVYQHTFSYSFGPTGMGHCFPSGHAAGGFALFALYFAACRYTRRPVIFLFPGLAVGLVFALGQQARGAHFLSHDLWTMGLCWFSALGLFLLFRPHRWPAPARPAGVSDGPFN